MEQEYEEGRGRSAKKRAAQQIEKLAQQLAEMPDKQLNGLELPEDLAAELELTRNTRGHSSRKRAIKHLAGQLRKDEELSREIEAHLAGTSEAHWTAQAQFHQLEVWRDRLCDPEQAAAALQELIALVPTLEIRELRRLSRAAGSGDKRAARKLFRLLRQEMAGASSD